MSAQECSLYLKLHLENSKKCDHCNKLVITQKFDISPKKSSKDCVLELSSETTVTNLKIQVPQQKQLQWQYLLSEEGTSLEKMLLLPTFHICSEDQLVLYHLSSFWGSGQHTSAVRILLKLPACHSLDMRCRDSRGDGKRIMPNLQDLLGHLCTMVYYQK